jgi:hypothetical protein
MFQEDPENAASAGNAYSPDIGTDGGNGYQHEAAAAPHIEHVKTPSVLQKELSFESIQDRILSVCIGYFVYLSIPFMEVHLWVLRQCCCLSVFIINLLGWDRNHSQPMM